MLIKSNQSLPRWMRSPARLVLAALLLASLAVFLFNCRKVWPFIVDDSFITFRYASNLASGIGPTFNPAPPRAEGYTSFLWMLVMVIPHLLSFGVISFARLVGFLSIAGSMALMIVFLRQAGSSNGRPYRLAAAGLLCLFLALLPETAVHTVSGMETAPYTFLLTGMTILAYFAIDGRTWALRTLPLAALLAGLMRPEANLLAVLVIAAVFAKTPQRKAFAFSTLLLYILPGALYFLWRWNYFGVLFPLPFYVKTGGLGLPGWSDVGAFGVFVLANLGLYLGLGMLGERRAVGLILLVVIPDLIFFLFSYPIMEYDYRFVFPVLPLILMLAGMGLALLLEKAAAWFGAGRGPWLAPAWLGLLVLIMFAGQSIPRTKAVFEHKLDYAQGMLRNHIAIGHILNQVAHGKVAPVLAVSDAGAMPYYAEWATVDAGGLNDQNIALRHVRPADYVFSFHPEVLVLMSTSMQQFQNDSQYARELYRLGLQDGLKVVARSPFYQGDTIWVLARPGGEAAARLSAGMNSSQ